MNLFYDLDTEEINEILDLNANSLAQIEGKILFLISMLSGFFPDSIEIKKRLE